MDIRQPKLIKRTARQLLDRSPQKSRILLIYCAILVGLSLAVTALDILLDGMMADAGGLSNLGTRSLLATFQSLLPFVNTLATMVLDLGLLAVLLRISRGQYVSAQTLRTGMARFFPLLRTTLLQAGIYLALGIAALNISSLIFFLTPFSNGLVELISPLATSQTDAYALLDAIMLEEALAQDFLMAVIPMYVILLVVLLVLFIPVSYRLRFSNFILLDDPRAGAFRALGGSFRMTKRHCRDLFRLDLSFWWFFLLELVAVGLIYGQTLLVLLDIPTPWSDQMGSYLFYGLYLVCYTMVMYFLSPRLHVSRALQYNALRPREEPQNQVVLGNIFQM